MPNQPRTPTVTVRLDRDYPGMTEELEYEASQLDRNRSDVVRDLVAWWLRKPGAKMPPRPTRHA